MAATERRQRRRTRIRQSILSAARELVASEGYGNVSLRKIADRIEYSAPCVLQLLSLEGRDILRPCRRRLQRACPPAVLTPRKLAPILPHEFGACSGRCTEFSQSNPGFLATVTVHGPAAGKDGVCCRFEYLRGVEAHLEADLSQCIAPGPLANIIAPARRFGCSQWECSARRRSHHVLHDARMAMRSPAACSIRCSPA